MRMAGDRSGNCARWLDRSRSSLPPGSLSSASPIDNGADSSSNGDGLRGGDDCSATVSFTRVPLFTTQTAADLKMITRGGCSGVQNPATACSSGGDRGANGGDGLHRRQRQRLAQGWRRYDDDDVNADRSGGDFFLSTHFSSSSPSPLLFLSSLAFPFFLSQFPTSQVPPCLPYFPFLFLFPLSSPVFLIFPFFPYFPFSRRLG
ncbi:uncharacterized protein DS421_12g356560 [Arachis hypogaea]|nr:uncharacterized protein DS421_12g356560 [Arachis hypogaea]